MCADHVAPRIRTNPITKEITAVLRYFCKPRMAPLGTLFNAKANTPSANSQRGIEIFSPIKEEGANITNKNAIAEEPKDSVIRAASVWL